MLFLTIFREIFCEYIFFFTDIFTKYRSKTTSSFYDNCVVIAWIVF